MTKKNSNSIDPDSVDKVEKALYTKALSSDDDAAAAQKTFLELQHEKNIQNKINEMFFPDTTCE